MPKGVLNELLLSARVNAEAGRKAEEAYNQLWQSAALVLAHRLGRQGLKSQEDLKQEAVYAVRAADALFWALEEETVNKDGADLVHFNKANLQARVEALRKPRAGPSGRWFEGRTNPVTGAVEVCVHVDGKEGQEVCKGDLGLYGHVLQMASSFSLKPGPGSWQLALAILACATGDEKVAHANYRNYAEQVVEWLPQWVPWKLTREEVLDWVSKNGVKV